MNILPFLWLAVGVWYLFQKEITNMLICFALADINFNYIAIKNK